MEMSCVCKRLRVLLYFEDGDGHVRRNAGDHQEDRVDSANGYQGNGEFGPQTAGKRIRQQQVWAWQQILPQALQIGAEPAQHLDFSITRPWAEQTSGRPDSGPAEPRANEQIRF